MPDRRLIIVVNEDRFFLSHRKEIGVRALMEGWDVAVVAKNTGRKNEVEALGLKFIEMPVNPTGKKIHQEMRTFRFLYSLYGREKDAVIHHVGLKNMVWGGLAARLRKMDGVVNAVSGLGIMFSDYNPSRLKKVLIPILRWGMSMENVSLIFQNHEDESLFQALGISEKTQTYFIKGSGVDLSNFDIAGRQRATEGTLKVVFAGRMVKDKGVLDVITAAEILRPKYEGKVKFLLCGGQSSNAFAVKKEELDCLCDGGYIKYLGYCENMPEIFMDSDIMCFPSYYREGVPKAVLEASAAGLPIITCDSIGCRDTVKEGINGFLVSPRSPEEVAEKLDILLSDSRLRERMGDASRQMAVNEYDVNTVADKHIKIYNQVLKNRKGVKK